MAKSNKKEKAKHPPVTHPPKPKLRKKKNTLFNPFIKCKGKGRHSFRSKKTNKQTNRKRREEENKDTRRRRSKEREGERERERERERETQ